MLEHKTCSRFVDDILVITDNSMQQAGFDLQSMHNASI